ncbi:MAG: hypothetical protein FJ304_03425 [Planctomycetes bacterium]|nr:hypothetical protein [Planctomycetota bacterium]
MRTKLLVAAVVLASAAVGRADEGLTKGTPELKSATTLAFGPKGVLFVGDSAGATIFAIDTGDTKSAGDKPLNVEKLDSKVASALGVTDGVRITDVKVNPASGNVYVSATRGTGAGTPALLKVARDGTVSAVSLKDIPFASIKIPNPGTGGKGPPQVITQMSFVSGKLIVAGLSSEEFASTLRVIPFPFKEADKGAGIQIFHAAHNGRLETNSPIRTFVAYKIGKEDHIMAAYTCTPLVKIPVSELKAGAKVKGTTIAELGNQNQPLDMIVYTKGGKDYVLMANSRHGILKLAAADFESAVALKDPVKGGGTAGVKAENVAELKDVVQLDKLDDGHALILNKAGDLKTVPLP